MPWTPRKGRKEGTISTVDKNDPSLPPLYEDPFRKGPLAIGVVRNLDLLHVVGVVGGRWRTKETVVVTAQGYCARHC
jgi:hypothetical protein